MGLFAFVVWRVAAWSPASTSADGNGPAVRDRAEPGLVRFPADERAHAPTLEGDTLDGDTFALSDLTGRIVVINVWGSWCGPCRAETPDLVRLAREYAGRRVRFVGINTRDSPASARSFVKKLQVPYPSLDDTDGRLLLAFRHVIPTAVVPSTVVIDPQGKVAARVIGRVTFATLKGLLDDEIAATGSGR
ncbi:MAG: TlpA disulfide reductase family protein [Marmoricola sp.]